MINVHNMINSFKGNLIAGNSESFDNFELEKSCLLNESCLKHFEQNFNLVFGI